MRYDTLQREQDPNQYPRKYMAGLKGEVRFGKVNSKYAFRLSRKRTDKAEGRPQPVEQRIRIKRKLTKIEKTDGGMQTKVSGSRMIRRRRLQ